MRRALALLASALALAVPARAGATLPWSVDVRVVAGAEPGPEALLEDLERGILADLNARGCFRDFRPASSPQESPPAPVLLEVTIAQVEEKTRYEQSQSERMNPTDVVATAVGYVEVIQAAVGVRLAVRPGDVTVREDAFRRTMERRPLTMTDDTRRLLREDFVREIARRTRAVVCKGSEARLEREIRTRLAADPAASGAAPR